MARIATYFHTLRRMRPTQILALVGKRILRADSRAVSQPIVQARGVTPCSTFIIPPVLQALTSGIECLNRYEPFRAGRPDWRSAGLPKLWRYNLHYFDFLLWPSVSTEQKAALMNDWIEVNPPGVEDAWEPYTVSLRVVNWVKYFTTFESLDSLPRRWVESLALQTAWLEKNLETHILANHYLKNAKALFFAGGFFDGEPAERWSALGRGILLEQAREQFLPSGAHYELSPMYHCICTEDVLDVLNLVRGEPRRYPTEFETILEDTAGRSLNFLSGVQMPDRQIPLFNDSAFRIAPEPEALFAYGSRLFKYQLPSRDGDSFPDAGYFVLGRGNDRMIIDCGSVSPPYQPGHTHCDMLSYELAIAGHRIVVDAGVFDYEDSAERRYCRSTRAHNSVCVDGEEQSELWGVFRVARRAKVVRAELTAEGSRFVGEIFGFPQIAGGISHRRTVEYSPIGSWIIVDEVQGRGVHRVDSYLHFHPEVQVKLEGRRLFVLDSAGLPVARVVPEDSPRLHVEKGWHFPEFGIKQTNTVLRLSVEARLPVSMRYRIEKIASSSGDGLPA